MTQKSQKDGLEHVPGQIRGQTVAQRDRVDEVAVLLDERFPPGFIPLPAGLHQISITLAGGPRTHGGGSIQRA